MRVAIYGRVSTEEQLKQNTIEAQLHACEEYCATKGHEITRVFRDEGVSGTIPLADRPQGGQLLEMAADKMFEGVVIYCVDRLSRDNATGVPAYNRLMTLTSDRVEFVTNSFDATPEGEFQFTMFMGIATYERRVIARRTAAGRYRKVREGVHMASVVAYGYAKGEDGRLEVDPQEADVVQRIFRWCVDEDMGLYAISAQLNDLAVTPPRHYASPARAAATWGPTTIGKLLRAERYTGQGTYGPETCAYPPIIDEVTFAAAGKALTRRHRFNKGGTKHDYLLQHLVRCRTCSSSCTVGHQGRDRLVAYTCNGWNRDRRHGKPYRWYAHHIEPLVRQWVEAAMRDPRALLAEVELYQAAEFDRIEEKAEQADAAEARLRSLAAEEQKVLEWGRKAYIEEAAMLRQLDQLKAERQELSARLAALMEEADDYDAVKLTADFREWALQYLAASLTAVDVPSFLKRWVKAVYVEADGSVAIEGVLPAGRQVEGVLSLSDVAAEEGGKVDSFPQSGVRDEGLLQLQPAAPADNSFPPF